MSTAGTALQGLLSASNDRSRLSASCWTEEEGPGAYEYPTMFWATNRTVGNILTPLLDEFIVYTVANTTPVDPMH